MGLAIHAEQATTPRPATLAIFFSLKCNYACFFCPRQHNSTYTDLPFERLEQLRPAIRDATMVDITGWGEPFMYPRIADAIRFITEVNPRDCISVTTNGSHFTEAHAELLSRNLHHVVFSLNAATRATYERDMVHGRWDHVLGNVERALRHIPGSKVILSFVAHLGNIDEFPEFVRLAARLGVTTVSLTSLIITKPELVTRSLWFDKVRANAAIDEARREGARLGVGVGSRRFDGTHQPPAPGAGCTSPYTETFVGVDGEVGACCFAGNQKMGNVHQLGFDAVWNGERYRALRKERFFPECKTCFAHASLDDLTTHLDKHLGEERYQHLPLISVVVPLDAGTSDEQLDASLRSLAWQTYPVHERVFALAGGRDELPAAVRTRLEGEQGVVLEGCGAGAEALARAAGEARGAYLALLAPGTCWHPEKLERPLKAFLAAGEACQVVGHRAQGTTPGAPRHGAVYRTEAVRRDPAGAAAVLAGQQLTTDRPDVRVLGHRLELRVPGMPLGPRHAWLAAVARRLNLVGEATFAGGDASAALDAFVTAAELCPSYAESWSNLAIHEWAASRRAQAVDLMGRAIALEPQNPAYRDNARVMLAQLSAGR
ncbi:MAG: radical SAM protein [Anaeromyxobacter sp.]|nr:radical SAM protein [Anaeromyxobacter sp.]